MKSVPHHGAVDPLVQATHAVPTESDAPSESNAMKPRVEITYCTQCRWLLRAAWMAQELLTTFEQEIAEVALRPGTGGVFEVRADGDTVWSRKAEGRFPDIRELKQRLRDRIAPDKPLGHSDRPVD